MEMAVTAHLRCGVVQGPPAALPSLLGASSAGSACRGQPWAAEVLQGSPSAVGSRLRQLACRAHPWPSSAWLSWSLRLQTPAPPTPSSTRGAPWAGGWPQRPSMKVSPVLSLHLPVLSPSRGSWDQAGLASLLGMGDTEPGSGYCAAWSMQPGVCSRLPTSRATLNQ